MGQPAEELFDSVGKAVGFVVGFKVGLGAFEIRAVGAGVGENFIGIGDVWIVLGAGVEVMIAKERGVGVGKRLAKKEAILFGREAIKARLVRGELKLKNVLLNARAIMKAPPIAITILIFLLFILEVVIL